MALSFVFALSCFDDLGATPAYDPEKNATDELPLTVAKMPGDSAFPCLETFDRTLPDGYYVSTNNPSGVVWSGEKIRIADNATVHFDRNVTIENAPSV